MRGEKGETGKGAGGDCDRELSPRKSKMIAIIIFILSKSSFQARKTTERGEGRDRQREREKGKKRLRG